MKRKHKLVMFELKYLFHQKFLLCMCVLGVLILSLSIPGFRNTTDFEQLNKKNATELNEAQAFIVDMWNTKKTNVETERSKLAKEAERKKETLSDSQRYEKEYLSAIQKKYEKDVFLEVHDYSGWETFALHKFGMAPHNPLSLLHIIMIVGAGLLLLTKDRENNTLFWAAYTGNGTSRFSFTAKIIATFIYGFVLQLAYSLFFIMWLWLVTGFDMKYWFYPIQNVPGYGMCDVQFSIVTCVMIDAVLKCLIALMITFVIFSFAVYLKRYLFLFIGGIVVSGGLYYLMTVMIEKKNFDIWWRLNPFSIFLLNRTFTYDAINICNHAIDTRVFVGSIWGILLVVFLVVSYQIWRRYSNENA